MKTLVAAFVLSIGLCAQAQLNSTLIDFGHVGYDSRTSRSVYFTNMSSQVVDRFSASVYGQGFTLWSNGCIAPLRQGQSCLLQVQFWGTQPGYASGTLTVYTNTASSSASLTAFVNPRP